LFAPHIDAQQIETAARAVSQRELDQLFRNSTLPVKNGAGERLSASARQDERRELVAHAHPWAPRH
jgi:hypothetical protein